MEGDEDRRKSERRNAQVPFEGEDRRRADRRSGTDRRAQERKATGPEEPAMSGNEDETEQDRRSSMRRSIELDVDLRDPDGLSYAAKLTDISEEGCLIRTVSGSGLARDRLHTIKITGHEAVTGCVVWSEKDKAGLTFSEPMDPATVQSLVEKSLYARMSRHAVRDASANDSLPPLPPFPFDD